MGVGTQQSGTFYTLSYGKIRKKVNKDTPGAEMRVNNNNQEVWELVYDYIEGIIASIERIEAQDADMSDQYRFELVDDQETSFLYVNAGASSNKLINKVINTLPNTNVKIIPHYFEDDKKSEFTVMNEVEPSKWVKATRLYTRDNPGGMPQIDGEWDSLDKRAKANFKYEMDDFFADEVKRWAEGIDALVREKDSDYDYTTEEVEKKPEDNGDEPDDDLPF